MNDFRLALRSLRKNPGFCALAVLTLALAIGVNSAVFTLINSVLLRPVVPVRPEEVVNVFTARQGANRHYRQFSHAEYLALREDKDVFADVAALSFALAGIGTDDGVRRSFAFFVSDNFFPLMGVKPAAGRFFTAGESQPSAGHPVVIASHELWQRMGGRPDFVGSTLRVNGLVVTVIGITPEGFSGLNALIAPDLWLPLGLYAQFPRPFSGGPSLVDLASPNNYTLNLTARLQRGLTQETARPRLPVLARRLTALQPPDAEGARELLIQTPSRFSISTQPTTDGPVGTLSLTLLGMAACVLLVGSLNLANMLLARGSARAKEIAIRLALGASRWRVIRQLLAEGLLLALAGGSGGLVLSVWANEALIRSLSTLFSSMNFSFVAQSRPDLLVLTATLGFCVLATLVFSLGPALKASRVDLVTDLKQQTGDPASGGGTSRFFAARHCLIMAQIALSLMLLVSAGLFFRGAMKAGGVDLGFEPAGDVVAEMDFSLGRTPETTARAALFSALDHARQLPGVTRTALATLLPYAPSSNDEGVVPASIGASAPPEELQKASARALYAGISSGYFDAVGVRLLRGRDFTDAETRDKQSVRVAIIDEMLAKKLFPRGDALGQRIRYTQPRTDGSPAEMEIVGIVAKHRQDVLSREPTPWLFVPLAHAYSPNVYLHARLATRDPAATLAVVNPLRAALRSLDPDLPLLNVSPFTDLVEKNIGLWIVRVGATLFGIFGVIALVLAVIGVYAVKSYMVARRTREIGIRMALGAHPRDVFALVMRQGALQTGVALAAGGLLALGAGRLLTHLLYDVSPYDPYAFGLAAVVLGAAALAACFLPARRATRVDPTLALRSE